jgi:hypothetical protein
MTLLLGKIERYAPLACVAIILCISPVSAPFSLNILVRMMLSTMQGLYDVHKRLMSVTCLRWQSAEV